VTPEELQGIRDKLGLTQLGLARRAGINRNTVARHEMGDLEIRRYFAILYRLLGHLEEKALPIIEPEMPKPGSLQKPRQRWRRRRKPK
jgi:Predicted transcriptional regulator with C-terminal CBS domains